MIEGLSKPPPPLEFANEDKQPSEATEGDDLPNEKEICVVKATERVPNAGGDFEWVWKVRSYLGRLDQG